MGRLTKDSVKTSLQPQPQASYGGSGQAFQSLQAAHKETVGLLYILRQLSLPGARYHRPSEPPDTDGVVEHQSSQQIVTDPLQRVAEFPIILLGKMIRITLQQFSFEPAKYLPNRSKFLRQRMLMSRALTIGRSHHHPSVGVT